MQEFGKRSTFMKSKSEDQKTGTGTAPCSYP